MGININSGELTNNPEETFNKIKKGWEQTKRVFAVSTTEKKSSGLGKVLQNTLGTEAVPSASGLFYFFKDKNLMELFSFKIHDSNSSNIKEDLLVYLALAKLKNENILSSMPQYLKDKIIRHFGNNIRALAESRKLLKSLGNSSIISELCQLSDYGIQDNDAMWVHTKLIKKLPPALRVYIGCSILFFGDPESADIVKIHKKSSKITYYLYDDFENKLLPEMHDRIKIDLSGQKLIHFDHRSKRNPEVVYFKERFINKDDSKYDEWKLFSNHLMVNGYEPQKIHIEQNSTLAKILKDFCA
ncbi:MAG: DNA phosphorothioation-associated putative methyltransferase [bacterium]|nr:DNA phosphorothioation-associated putative methyltransferase [bacterium]